MNQARAIPVMWMWDVDKSLVIQKAAICTLQLSINFGELSYYRLCVIIFRWSLRLSQNR